MKLKKQNKSIKLLKNSNKNPNMIDEENGGGWN